MVALAESIEVFTYANREGKMFLRVRASDGRSFGPELLPLSPEKRAELFAQFPQLQVLL